MSSPQDLFDRARVLALLHAHTKSESLRRHAYAVEAAMRAAARRTGGDETYWGAVGLIHDFDYEQYADLADHPFQGAAILRAEGYPEDFVATVLSHASHTGVPRENDCARWLFAVDELCGFCMACAMVTPERKLAQVEVRSVRKKLKKKDFAAKVSREEIAAGAAALGLEQDEVIALVLGALVEAAGDLGL
ncbi:MAG: HDIG domain-containing protein [Candidatus Krumholzibacteria bacterium]|jgi:putative nucleotidyltransferase with HDIG domain|nr:HDIG domain-containing protein [Candidatus Krumholzibacteria bacterium]